MGQKRNKQQPQTRIVATTRNNKLQWTVHSFLLKSWQALHCRTSLRLHIPPAKKKTIPQMGTRGRTQPLDPLDRRRVCSRSRKPRSACNRCGAGRGGGHRNKCQSREPARASAGPATKSATQRRTSSGRESSPGVGGWAGGGEGGEMGSIQDPQRQLTDA